MKRVSLLTLAVLLIGTLFSTQVMAQGRINLNASKTTQECRNVKLDGFSASFSYSSIESQDVNTEKGVFSVLNMGNNSIAAGNIGDPQVLVTRELIAVPFGATPVVNVKSYTVEEYNLADYGINRLYPQQPSQSKSEKDVKFVYNESAYAAKGFDESRPIAEVTVMGTMRGIQIGALQLNTLRYDASSNTIRVYNNVEVEVNFENADLALTEKTLVNTYSPYFRPVYSMLFNERAIRDVYDDHPDLWAVPVKILVVANRMFEDAMQPWITWKTEKGFYLDVNYTDEIGTTASAIKTFIHNKYNEGVAAGQAPTFLIIFGDNNQVPASQTGSASHCVTDLYYYTTDNDVFGDMYHSRFTCETVDELNNVLNKSLMYEQYTMPDPSYLSNTLLIAGWDSYWTAYDGAPSIQYALEYYYNAEHGFANVYNWLGQPYTGCYAPMDSGVGFVNYTAHGSNTSWADPSFTNSNVNQLTNTDMYFWAMGNCCQAADWGISGKCLGETFIIAPNKAAFAYVGSCPSTYWYEDYYFTVGATNVFGQMPTFDQTSIGIYDTQFQDDFNSLSAVPFVGNVAVAYAHANGYQGSVSDQYYWESYHVLGDGSICYYHVNPTENTVSHMPTLPIGMDFYTVSADPGSYVGISKDGVLYGAGEIGEEGTADIPITPITSGGNAKIVVTHPQRQPYVMEVPCAAMTGAYVAVDSYALNADQANYGETIDMDVTLKNVGTLASGAITATLTTDCEYVEILNAEGTLAALNPDQLGTINGYQFAVAENVPDKTKAQFVLEVTDGTDTWNANINITLHAPVLAFDNIQTTDSNVSFTFKNTGTAPFYGGVLSLTSCSPDLVFENDNITVDDVVEGGQTLNIETTYTVDPSVELGTTFEVAYNFSTGLFEIEDIFVLSYGAIMDDFESGVFGDNWTFSPANAWTIVDAGGNPGKCAKSMNEGIASSDYSATLTVNVLAAGELTFDYKISSETNYDKLFFYMDNQEKAQWSGNGSWEQFTQAVTVGQHTFKWTYHKDSSVNSNDDCARIDNIKFPPVNVITFIEPATELTYEVSGHVVTLNWDASSEATSYVVKRDGETLGSTTETTYEDEIEESGIYRYSIYAVNADGAMSAPISVLIEMDYTGVAENQNANISVYPNPANDIVNINVNGSFKYQVINSLGQVVRNGNATNKAMIKVSDLNKGIYFLNITTGNQVNVQKVVVE